MIRLVMLATGMIFLVIAITSTPVNAAVCTGDTSAWICPAGSLLPSGTDVPDLPLPPGGCPGTGMSLQYSPGSLFTSTDALYTPPCLPATHLPG